MSALLPTSGGILSDVITWVRRIIKQPSDQSISDQTIGDYINRFYVYDVPARVQLFELRRQYTFQTIPNIFMYQFPYQQYQLLRDPAYCDGVRLGFYNHNDQFYNVYPEFVNNQFSIQGNGTVGVYTIAFGRQPILRGFTDDLGNLLPYVYITAIDSTGQQAYIVDNGFGILNQTDSSFQTILVPNAGTVDYLTGMASFQFLNPIPFGEPINSQTSPYSPGTPRILLFYNNTIKLYPVPSRSHKIQVEAQITPAQFLDTTDAVPFAYMAEYLARGAARKILSDNESYEQFQFYEPMFREQECQVLRRTNRQEEVTRTPTIFSHQTNNSPAAYTQY